MPLDTRDAVLSAAVSIASSSRRSSATTVDMRFAGALTFSEDGVLFVGDNHTGAIYALEDVAGNTARELLDRDLTPRC